jgi:hypothetical protein
VGKEGVLLKAHQILLAPYIVPSQAGSTPPSYEVAIHIPDVSASIFRRETSLLL